MSGEVVAALIVGAGSLSASIIAWAQSREATKEATAAKEAALRQEQMRVKATEAGEKLLDGLGTLIVGVESAKKHIEMTGGIEVKNPTMEGLFNGLAEANDLLNGGAAIYLTPEIRERATAMLRPAYQGGLQLNKDWLDQFAKDLRDEFDAIARLFRTTYLEPATG